MGLSLLFLSLLLYFHSHTMADDPEHTRFIFKGCARQKFQDPSALYSQTLPALLASLVTQSSEKLFYTTTSGDGQNSILGLYQCRGDLTPSQCSACVNKIHDKIFDLCDRSIAARIQLSGCYLRYEVSGFTQVPNTEFLYRVCGSARASLVEFEGKRDTAFGMVVNGVNGSGNAGNGAFYTGSFQEVYVLGQCEGDLNAGDCGDCVANATDVAKYQCGDSISGQAYLQKCFISYTYYPNGVPSISKSSGPARRHTQRTVAIAVGGVAALAFLIVCLMFLKSVLKKEKRSSKHESYY